MSYSNLPDPIIQHIASFLDILSCRKFCQLNKRHLQLGIIELSRIYVTSLPDRWDQTLPIRKILAHLQCYPRDFRYLGKYFAVHSDGLLSLLRVLRRESKIYINERAYYNGWLTYTMKSKNVPVMMPTIQPNSKLRRLPTIKQAIVIRAHPEDRDVLLHYDRIIPEHIPAYTSLVTATISFKKQLLAEVDLLLVIQRELDLRLRQLLESSRNRDDNLEEYRQWYDRTLEHDSDHDSDHEGGWKTEDDYIDDDNNFVYEVEDILDNIQYLRIDHPIHGMAARLSQYRNFNLPIDDNYDVLRTGMINCVTDIINLRC